MFFFEKKNQKTFVRLRFAAPGSPGEERAVATAKEKVFLLLFLQKKKALSFS